MDRLFRNVLSIPKSEKPMTPEQIGQVMEIADFKKMNSIRAWVDDTVKKKGTAEALKPWYRQFPMQEAVPGAGRAVAFGEIGEVGFYFKADLTAVTR